MSKPTKGPWAIIDRTASYIDIGGNRQENVEVIGLREPAEFGYESVCRVYVHAPGEANAALIARAPELLADNTELTADLRTASDQCEALSKDLADHKQLLQIKKRQLDTMVQENRRLRELLRQYKHRLDKRWREGTRMDAYARGYQDGIEAAEVIFDDVFNAIGRTGE